MIAHQNFREENNTRGVDIDIYLFNVMQRLVSFKNNENLRSIFIETKN